MKEGEQKNQKRVELIREKGGDVELVGLDPTIIDRIVKTGRVIPKKEYPMLVMLIEKNYPDHPDTVDTQRYSILQKPTKTADRFRMLSYGSKILLVEYDPGSKRKTERGRFLTHLLTNPDAQSVKQKNETAYLYTALKMHIVEQANKEGRTMEYTYVTRNQNLIDFATSIGEQIFHFEEKEIKQLGEGRVYGEFTSHIKPGEPLLVEN